MKGWLVLFRRGKKWLAEFYQQHDQTALCDPDDGPIAFAFWHDSESQEARLPSVDYMGLSSAVKGGGFKRVILLSYQELDVPAGVTRMDASEFLEVWAGFLICRVFRRQ